MSLQVKKIIALSCMAVYCITAIYGFIIGRVEFKELLPTITMIIGYYFGRGHGEGLIK